MIVFDENMQQRSIMDAVAAWYRGRVISVTVLRPNTLIKDETISTLLRSAQRPTFVPTNIDNFGNAFQRIPYMALWYGSWRWPPQLPRARLQYRSTGKEACKDSDVMQGVPSWRLQWVGASLACDRGASV